MEGKVVLITGGLRGIGRATALRFADAGATVVATSRTVTGATHPDDPRITARQLDVRQEASVVRIFEWIDAEHGRLDVLVNNAGTGVFKPAEEITADEWSEVVVTNLTGAFLCAREAFRRMRAQGGGRIVNMGSIADHRALPGNAAYGASKFGLRGLSLVLAEEGASCNVRVSLVSPGAVRTEIWQGRDGFDPADMLDPDDVAALVLDLARRPLSVRIDEVRMAPPRGVL